MDFSLVDSDLTRYGIHTKLENKNRSTVLSSSDYNPPAITALLFSNRSASVVSGSDQNTRSFFHDRIDSPPVADDVSDDDVADSVGK